MPPGRAVNQRRAAEENELDWRIKDISYDEADPIFYIYPDEDQEEVVEFVFDDQSFAEEDSYFSGEQYFQSKIVEPVTTSDDPLGLVVSKVYKRVDDNDLIARYDGQLMDEGYDKNWKFD
ncbi:hypothetical protein CDL15_Pgr011005 [Punica granatum]|uniref:Uncharacterized protein n=1 Tax=Punica granatum TaxID=22663 RepID=A0A218XNV1_PUNGR|nr:hypothetical protein CDL15_Pgr011005 [Punica granatum]